MVNGHKVTKNRSSGFFVFTRHVNGHKVTKNFCSIQIWTEQKLMATRSLNHRNSRPAGRRALAVAIEAEVDVMADFILLVA